MTVVLVKTPKIPAYTVYRFPSISEISNDDVDRADIQIQETKALETQVYELQNALKQVKKHEKQNILKQMEHKKDDLDQSDDENLYRMEILDGEPQQLTLPIADKHPLTKRTKHDRLKNYNTQTLIDPSVVLKSIIGFSGKTCPSVLWSRSEALPKEIVYSSGSIIIASNKETGQQRHFIAHNSSICCLDIDPTGQYLASAQNGKALIKIWNYDQNQEICTLESTEFVSITSINYAFQRISIAGVDEQGRDVIKIVSLENFAKPYIMARQISDFNIIALKFCPSDADKLVSCGRQNIRFWRIKDRHLPAQTVILNQHARNSVFTCLGFAFKHSDNQTPLDQRQIEKVLVGSRHHVLYVVDYEKRVLVEFFTCHSGPITSISIGDGFCITGSEDRNLRVWSFDFSEPLFEAQNDGAIVGTDISQDDNQIEILVGTALGTLGAIHLPSYVYKAYSRSHLDEVLALRYHSLGNCLITISRDQTVRVWNLLTNEQTQEFNLLKDDSCLSIATSPSNNLFVLGFTSGMLSILDLEKVCTLRDIQLFERPITKIVYNHSGNILIAVNNKSVYSALDTRRDYAHIKTIYVEFPGDSQGIAFTHDDQIFAIVGDSATNIHFYSAKTFRSLLKILIQDGIIMDIQLTYRRSSQTSDENEIKYLSDLIVTSKNSNIFVYEVQRKGELLQANMLRELLATHRGSIRDLAVSFDHRYIATVGGDQLLKLWNYDFLSTVSGKNQTFIGHCSTINQVVYIQNMKCLVTAGGPEGLFIWSIIGGQEAAAGDDTVDSQMQELQIDSTQTMQTQEFQKLMNETKRHEFTQLGNSTLISSQLKTYSDDLFEREQRAMEEKQNQIRLEEQAAVERMKSINAGHLDEVALSSLGHETNVLSSQKVDSTEIEEEEEAETELFKKEMADLNIKSVAKQDYFKFMTKFEIPQTIEFQYCSQKGQRLTAKKAILQYAANPIYEQLKCPHGQYIKQIDIAALKRKNNLLKENNTSETFRLQYIAAYCNVAHNNLCWNRLLGWIAYSVENILIVEYLQRKRKQGIITLPQQISALSLCLNDRYLLVGTASVNEHGQCPIYVIETYSRKITKTLLFHTHGVQQVCMSAGEKYIVSIGNYQECTVAVWSWPQGQLVTSSYTLDKINCLQIPANVKGDYELEFVTAGRDQIQFWALTKEKKLEYYDIFAQKEEDGTIPELTAIQYLYIADDVYILAGTQRGQILAIDGITFKTLACVPVAKGEITSILNCRTNYRLIVTSLDGHAYVGSYNSLGFDLQQFRSVDLGIPPTSIASLPDLSQFIIGTEKGGLYHINFNERFQKLLVGTPDSNVVFKSFHINDSIIAISHIDGRFVLYSLDTAEQLQTFYISSPITAALYDSRTQTIQCLTQDNKKYIILHLTNFKFVEFYENQRFQTSANRIYAKQLIYIEGKHHHYQIVFMSDSSVGWINADDHEQKQPIKLIATVSLHNATELVPMPEIEGFLVLTDNGQVQAWSLKSANREIPELECIDDFDLFHSELQSIKETDEKIAETSVTLAQVLNQSGSYVFLTNSLLSKVFIRDIFKRSFSKILDTSPNITHLAAYDSVDDMACIVAFADGTLRIVSFERGSTTRILGSYLNGPFNGLYANRDQKKIVCVHPNGICIYRD